MSRVGCGQGGASGLAGPGVRPPCSLQTQRLSPDGCRLPEGGLAGPLQSSGYVYLLKAPSCPLLALLLTARRWGWGGGQASKILPSTALGYLDVRVVDTDYSSFAVVYIYKELEGALSTMVQLYSEPLHPSTCPALTLRSRAASGWELPHRGWADLRGLRADASPGGPTLTPSLEI